MESYPQHIVDKEAKTGDNCIRCNKLLIIGWKGALIEIHPGMAVAGRSAGGVEKRGRTLTISVQKVASWKR
jgi:hypothetical protein